MKKNNAEQRVKSIGVLHILRQAAVPHGAQPPALTPLLTRGYVLSHKRITPS